MGAVLAAGDPMAHFGLGYTLLEVGDLHGAYKAPAHLHRDRASARRIYVSGALEMTGV